MPNLPFHIATAYKIANSLGEKYVPKNLMGYCLFGSTVPDIRAMTKTPRGQTHFTELTVDVVGTGTITMFDAHPELLKCSVQPEMKAFLCGYISHLICDETWITKMYRPHFSETNRKCSEIESNLWDRALQLELDREAVLLIAQHNLMNEFPDDLTGVKLNFIDSVDLVKWQEWVQGLNGREFSWDRLYNAMRRMHNEDGTINKLVEDFIISIESNLNVIHDYIETDILPWYLDNTVLVSIDTIKRYMN